MYNYQFSAIYLNSFSLATEKIELNFTYVIFKLTLVIGGWGRVKLP